MKISQGVLSIVAESSAHINCHGHDGHNHAHGKTDWLLWISGAVVVLGYIFHFHFLHDHMSAAARFTGAIYEMMNSMFWGVVVGILALGFLSRIPRDLVMSVLGPGGGLGGILRATLAGVMFDVCSHAILMVGSKLYE